MSRHAIFSSVIFLEYLLPILYDEQLFDIPIYTYKSELHRKNRSFDLKNYKSFFNIVELSFGKFSELKNSIRLSDNTTAIFLDWNKEFLDETANFFSVYVQPALLPMYRGYGAITEQFLRGVSVSGITFYLPSDITDAGDILYQKEIRIDFEDYPEDFIRKVCGEVLSTIKTIDLSKCKRFSQRQELSFSLGRIRKRDAIIDFRTDALSVYNHIRGFSRPFFGAFCYYEGERIVIWRGKPERWQGVYGEPGEILKITDDGTEVACGNGTVILTEMENSVDVKKSFVFNKYANVFETLEIKIS
ncbi:formyltransferase family protein [Calditerrivibrio nitroreducens]|uniref:formyltransferase family protein n=1 Tax=Calditerrivibrio nitroreducens TaxID=477976 RepID=UPI003C7181DC